METPTECITGGENDAIENLPYEHGNRNTKNIKVNDFDSFTKEELIDKVRKLTIHVNQLRNVIQKSVPTGSLSSSTSGGGVPYTKRSRKDATARAFDFSIHPRRHILLKFAYLGWDYQGFAVQEDSDQTIEAHLFAALIRTRLIESRETSNYHRCGRTDKGVSAFAQVISIDLRCKQRSGRGIILPEKFDANEIEEAQAGDDVHDGNQNEIDYVKILNRVLPPEIKVLGWAPVDSGFSARFDCIERTYRYYFPLADLDTEKMYTASQFLLGTHDFRNFCKLDPTGDNPTIRRMISVDLVVPTDESDKFYSIGKLIIKGQSFVWHQIRCIVAILILVGKGLEEPSIVKQLLDLEKQPKKPQYSMAMDYPLVLYDVQYGEAVGIQWKYDPENLDWVITELQKLWVNHRIKSSMIYDMIRDVESQKNKEKESEGKSSLSSQMVEHLDSLIMGSKSKVYKKLVDRPTCDRERNLTN